MTTDYEDDRHAPMERGPTTAPENTTMPFEGANNTAFLDSQQVAAMMGISVTTLRNYVWLQGLTKKERAERRLQTPPAKMPKPKRVRGQLFWVESQFTAWQGSRKKR
jgi:predicted DNA-binding transcriptional regulator AlpA